PLLLLCGIVFFFQAEDGIRDWSVTGVQTCALPISHGRPAGCRAESRLRVTPGRAPRRRHSPAGARPQGSRPGLLPPNPRRSRDRPAPGGPRGPGSSRRRPGQAERKAAAVSGYAEVELEAATAACRQLAADVEAESSAGRSGHHLVTPNEPLEDPLLHLLGNAAPTVLHAYNGHTLLDPRPQPHPRGL